MLNAICFGDTLGLPQLLTCLPYGMVTTLVAASIRPQYHAALQELAAKHSIPLLIQPRRASDEYPAFVDQIRQLRPDLILVNSYSMLLPPELLGIPKRGAINIHGALLPQYRGCNPMQWAIINNETETGVTMHYMDANFDTGDIIAQKQVPIRFEDTWLDVQQRIATATEALLAEQIPLVLSDTNSRTLQSEEQAGYCRRRTPEDGRFDWSWKAVDIYNLIRALVHPHPGAFYLDAMGNKIVIDRFIPYDTVRLMQFQLTGKVVE